MHNHFRGRQQTSATVSATNHTNLRDSALVGEPTVPCFKRLAHRVSVAIRPLCLSKRQHDMRGSATGSTSTDSGSKANAQTQ